MTDEDSEITVDEPIGGEYALTGGTEKTVHKDGEFQDVVRAVVKHPQEDSSHHANEVGKVVDLLNKWDAETIRERTINGDTNE